MNGGTRMLPVTVPLSVVSVLVSVLEPLNVEPFGSTTGSFSFFGVSEPQTAQFSNLYGFNREGRRWTRGEGHDPDDASKHGSRSDRQHRQTATPP